MNIKTQDRELWDRRNHWVYYESFVKNLQRASKPSLINKAELNEFFIALPLGCHIAGPILLARLKPIKFVRVRIVPTTADDHVGQSTCAELLVCLVLLCLSWKQMLLGMHTGIKTTRDKMANPTVCNIMKIDWKKRELSSLLHEWDTISAS